MVIVLTGKNGYALHAAQQEILASHTAEHGDSIERFDAHEMTDTDGLLDAVRSISFLEPHKLVVVRDFSQHKAVMAKIEDIVGQTADSTTLLLIDPAMDKRTAAYKYLKKETDVREYKDLAPFEVESWASAHAQELGAQLGSREARMLVERIGPDQHRLANEIKKMSLNNTTITADMIMEHTEPTPQSKVFDMLDALFQGRAETAWKLYQDQRAQGEEPQKIMAMITWQLQQLALAVFAPNQTQDELVAAGMSPYSAKKSLGMARHLSQAQLRQYINELARIDAQSKTSADVESALAVYFSIAAARTS